MTEPVEENLATSNTIIAPIKRSIRFSMIATQAGKMLLSIVVLLLLWFIASRKAKPLFLPKPEVVYESFSKLFVNGMLFQSLWDSFARITIATMLASFVSIPLGLLVVSMRAFERLITPITGLMRYLPVTVFYPLLVMWLGTGASMKVAFLFVATFFFFLPSVVLAIKETSQELIDTGYTMGMGLFQVITRVLLPNSLPSICENFLMMYGIGWTYVIIAEIITTDKDYGLGHIMNLGQARGRTDLVFVSLITIVVFSKIFDLLGTKLIRRIFAWKYARVVSG